MSKDGKRGGMFAFIPGQHKPKPVRNGAIFLVLVLAVLFMGYTKNIPLVNEGAMEVNARVTNSVNIFPGNEVRVNGVKVGKVKKVERAPGGQGSTIKMAIQDDDVKIKTDARASVYWRTLLGGNFYVELQPGSPSAADLTDGGTIPLSHTTSQVEFDQLLTSFDADARAGTRTFFDEFKKGFEGQAAGRAIERLGPGLQSVGPAMKATRGVLPGKDIPELARNGSRALGALVKSESRLAGLIDGANTTLAVTAARRQDIGSMLDQAPATFDETRSTLARVRTTLDELDPVADRLRPGVKRLDETVATTRPAMRELTQFVPDAMPVLRDAEPALRSLRTASRSAVPLMTGLAPTLDRLTNEINPWLGKRHAVTGLTTAQGIGPFFAQVGTAAQNFDGNGFGLNFDTLNGIGDMFSGSVDCDKLAIGVSECKALLTIIGKALGAGPSIQKAP